ncbi:hypothetical protein GLOIN_2v616434 [Rhizophagus irregularis DAOM 181602=DAOM 197198]|nr:hypothetical protein GLOIN_2v616434 [Rhizophagus irregularis DAOM 181602=DAOM 197198]CAB4488570.1 unnamed protein product [Rhizophagus irregularis]
MDISYILIFFPSIVIAQSDKEQNNDDAFIDNLFFTILPIIISIIAFTDKENDHIHYGYWVNLFHTVVSSHLLPLVLSIINEFATEDAPRAIIFLTQSANFIKKVRKGKDGGLLWIMDHIQWFIVQLIYCNILIKCDENKLNLCDDCKRLRGDCENPSPCKILCCNCTNPCKGFQLCDDCKRKIGKAPQWVVKRIHCYISLRADLNHLKDGKIAISSHPFEAN